MLNAVVAELSIHKLKDERGRFDSKHSKRSSVLSDERRLGAKLRVTENRCVLFNTSTYAYYIHMYIFIFYSHY